MAQTKAAPLDARDREAVAALVEHTGYVVPDAAALLVIVAAESEDVEERARACAALRCLDPGTVGDALGWGRGREQRGALDVAARAVGALVFAIVDEPHERDRVRMGRLLAGVIAEARRVAARKVLREHVTAS